MRFVAFILGAIALSACQGPLSTLKPAGRDAERIQRLFAWMAAGAGLVWLLVMGLAVYAMVCRERPDRRAQARFFIIGGGTLLPVFVLGGLLAYGLGMMPALLDQGEEDGIEIRIVGEQWWWRVRYDLKDGSTFELANELRLPVGRRLPLRLETRDVIHSFWVPSLGGKTDMIPGRVNRTALEPTKTGVFWGACAEYCGSSHARMLLRVAVVGAHEFDRWLVRQRAAAAEPAVLLARRGARRFEALGCGACHTVRGTHAEGTVGPDLTHVGSRLSIGAGILEPTPASFRAWLAETEELKPGVHMPAFDMLSEQELRELSIYLDGLK